MSKIITGSWVWITRGLHDGKYGQVLSFSGVYAEVMLTDNTTTVVPIAYLKLAAQ